ncbi:MAG: RNA polymerase sigma factor [Candidatus Aminicenantes bacterium]|jgi:RNA polymerase sigma factor (sigma-70 family)
MSATIRKKRLSEFLIAEYGKLVRYVRWTIDDSADREAEDIVQDVIVNLFDKADFTIPIENLTAYVYQSLKNKIVDIFRKRAKSPQISLDDNISNGANQGFSLAELIRDARSHTASEEEKKEMYTHLYNAIEALNDKEKTVIVATEFEGVPFGKLSQQLGVPIGTLLARKSRALKKIRSTMKNMFKEDNNDRKKI